MFDKSISVYVAPAGGGGVTEGVGAGEAAVVDGPRYDSTSSTVILPRGPVPVTFCSEKYAKSVLQIYSKK